MTKTSQEIRDAFGYLLEHELPFLKNLIDDLPDNSVCINIGAGSGTSGLAFMENKRVGSLYTVDIFGQTRAIGGIGNEKQALQEAGFGNDPRYHSICGDSTEVGKIWTGGDIDMVFVDGEHTYEHCQSDILAWLPHIKHNGIMAVHDYESVHWQGVEKAVDEELRPRYELIALVQTLIAFRIVRDE